MQQYLDLLGLRVKDVVTGVTGIVTSIGFDLYGCVQGLVMQTLTAVDGKSIGEQFWFDTKRLVIIDDDPVMPRPDFIAPPGGHNKPAFPRRPAP